MNTSLTVAGVQDGSFEPFRRGIDSSIQYTSLCCTCLQAEKVRDVGLARVTVDGLDSTVNIVNILGSWMLDAIILGGATFAGFNVVDVENVYNETGTPVIVFSAEKPDMDSTLEALRKHFPDWRQRWSRYEALGEIHSLRITGYPEIYFEIMGCSKQFAEKVLKEQAITGRVPEAVRVANLIAKGVSSIFQGQAEYAGDSPS
ncbi:MAG: DUF99 family protein [Candidatus Bathyarchaeota archaeon]|nr:DUF99 family protein [Candidatus Bathyarchaeota archaeon]